MRTMTPTLWASYADTDYVGGGIRGFAFRVAFDAPSKTVDRAFTRYRASRGALITAYNPWSRASPVFQNRRRALRLWRRAGRWPRAQGLAIPVDPNWELEPGVFIFRISRRRALRLARAFGQRAIVWIEKRKPGRILMTLA